MAATSKNMLRKLNQYISSYEATKGRKPSPQLVQSFLEAELSAQYARAGQDRQIGIQEKELGIREQERKDAKSAAKMSGAIQVASLGAQGYLGYKYLTKPSPGSPNAPGSAPSVAPNGAPQVSGSSMAPTTGRAPSVTGQITPSGEIRTPQWNAPAAPAGSTSMPVTSDRGAFDPETGGFTDTYMSQTGGQPVFQPSMAPATVSSAGALSGGNAAAFDPGTGEFTAEYMGAEGAPQVAGGTTIGGVPLGPAALAVTSGLTGIEAMRKAQGEGWGQDPGEWAAKGATKITPWNDDSTAGKILNAVNPLTPAVGIVNMAVKTVKAITGGTVICTELCNQGYLTKRVLDLDGEHRLNCIDEATYIGYMRWAKHVVVAMQKYPITAKLIAPVGRAWAYEMAHRVDSEIPGSWFGKVLMKIGIPICRWLGRGRA